MFIIRPTCLEGVSVQKASPVEKESCSYKISPKCRVVGTLCFYCACHLSKGRGQQGQSFIFQRLMASLKNIFNERAVNIVCGYINQIFFSRG